MKRFILFTFSLLLTFTIAIAQDGINYQGAATDANGDELTNQNITLRASVLSATANGNLEWEETHSATTDQFGLFNVVIGQGTNTTNGSIANFDDMDWGSGNHFLKIEMDATGGTNYAMIGTTQMMSVPYALYAKSAGIDSTMLADFFASNEQDNNGDFSDQSNSQNDFSNNDVLNSIPQNLDGNSIILYSTERTIYLTDSIGSFLSPIYTTNNDYIYGLNKSSTGDTLYFLQATTNYTPPSIMMFTVNDLNPVVIGSIPIHLSDIKEFKYFLGAFYYLTQDKIWKTIGGTTVQVATSYNNVQCISNQPENYFIHYSNGNYYFNGGNSGISEPQDLTFNSQDNNIYVLSHYGVGKIFKFTSQNVAGTAIVDLNGTGYTTTTSFMKQNIRVFNNKIYFNLSRTLFSVNTDGSALRIISTSTNSNEINGVVVIN
jgi:hypothetical protein